jgi:hypothetical protein
MAEVLQKSIWQVYKLAHLLFWNTARSKLCSVQYFNSWNFSPPIYGCDDHQFYSWQFHFTVTLFLLECFRYQHIKRIQTLLEGQLYINQLSNKLQVIFYIHYKNINPTCTYILGAVVYEFVCMLCMIRMGTCGSTELQVRRSHVRDPMRQIIFNQFI